MAQAKEVSESRRLQLSPSVASAKDRFADGEAISAAALTRAVLELHRTDDAGGKASKLSLDATDAAAERRPAQAWLQESRTLFDARLVGKLHARLGIIDLSLLEIMTKAMSSFKSSESHASGFM